MYRKTVKGYTAQSRYYAAHLERSNGEWLQLGWIVDRGCSKPVFELLDGTPVAIYNGSDHLTVVVQEIDRAAILATEEECYEDVYNGSGNPYAN